VPQALRIDLTPCARCDHAARTSYVLRLWLRQGRDADDDVYNDFVMPSMRLPIYAAGPTAAERLPAVQAEMNKLKS
jgi:hypothetical protein